MQALVDNSTETELEIALLNKKAFQIEEGVYIHLRSVLSVWEYLEEKDTSLVALA